MKNEVVFLACPSHDPKIHYSVATALFNATRKHTLYRQFNCTSLLAWNFNQLYAACLNLQKKHRIKWFVMLHSDVAPELFWLDKLLDIAEKNNADMLSAVLPFKNGSGLTSTAIAHPADPFSFYTRLTMRQVWDPAFPETFDFAAAYEALAEKVAEDLRLPNMPETLLLANTGLMALRMNRPWSEQLYFTIADELRRTPNDDFAAVVAPEDWNVSHAIHLSGGKVMATRAIKADHIATSHAWPSQGTWGLAIDNECLDLVS